MSSLASSGSEAEASWERAWPPEEVRAGSQCWSLAADAGLLHFLQDFSQQTISRMHEIKKQMDRLVHETKSTDCRLHNIFNGFLMLSNTQFIENRVYDDEMEETMAKNEVEDKPEQERTREQKEVDLILKIQEAVTYGLQVLDSNFEQLDIKAGNSDSEEETSERAELILEPKDLYIDRPLPYLIGSQLFMEQDDVGLGEYSSEGTEGSVDSAHGSIIDSEGKNEEEFEDELGNESEEDQKLRTTVMSEEDEDLFGDSEKGEEEDGSFEENTQLNKKRPASFTEELAARIKEDVLFKQEEEQSPNVKNKITVTAKGEVCNPSDDEEDLFKPPKLTDEDFSPFGSTVGLFSTGTAFFDDESDLFVDLPKEKDVAKKEARIPINDEPSLNGVRKLPAGAVSLFPGRNNIFTPSQFPVKNDVKEPSQPMPDKASKSHESISLFDDDDDDDDLESDRKKSISAKSSSEPFDAERNVFKKKPDVTSINNAAKESKELMADDKTKPSFADQKNLFSDEEDPEQNLFTSPQPIKPKTSSFSSVKLATKTPLQLFEDEDEEELFKAVPKIQKSNLLQGKGTSLLFSSDEEVREEDHSNIVEENNPAPEFTSYKKSLFDDEGEDDLFVITTDSQRKSQKPALLFEDDAENGDSLFSFQPPSQSSDVHAPFPEKDTKSSVSSMFSLFEEEEKNEETDVSRTRKREIPKPSEKTIHSKSTGVFQDEELLFNHKLQKDNDPEVDLFANCRKEIPKSGTKMSPGGELFGADDGDGLFNFPKANVDTDPEVLLPGAIPSGRPLPAFQKTLHSEPHSRLHGITESASASSIETGVSFDDPMQADTLQSVNKNRVKITGRRRPPSRAARRLSAEESGRDEVNTADGPSVPFLKEGSGLPAVFYPYKRELYRKESTEKSKLPVPTTSSNQQHEANDGFISASVTQTHMPHLLGTRDLFPNSSASKVTVRSDVQVETEIPKSAAEFSVPSVLEDPTDEDIFHAKKPPEKFSPPSVLEDKDLFTADKEIVKTKVARPALHSDQDNAIQDIFEEDIFASEAVKVPAKTKTLEANLFGDDSDIDIFTDLAVKPQKNIKKKMETKSIFDENIDDIFSPSGRSKTSVKKAQSFQASSGTKSESRTSSTFEDPLNAFGSQ